MPRHAGDPARSCRRSRERQRGYRRHPAPRIACCRALSSTSTPTGVNPCPHGRPGAREAVIAARCKPAPVATARLGPPRARLHLGDSGYRTRAAAWAEAKGLVERANGALGGAPADRIAADRQAMLLLPPRGGAAGAGLGRERRGRPTLERIRPAMTNGWHRPGDRAPGSPAPRPGRRRDDPGAFGATRTGPPRTARAPAGTAVWL